MSLGPPACGGPKGPPGPICPGGPIGLGPPIWPGGPISPPGGPIGLCIGPPGGPIGFIGPKFMLAIWLFNCPGIGGPL